MLPKLNLILLPIIAIIIMLIFKQSENRIYADKGQLVITQNDQYENSVVFSWQRHIEVPMARHIEKAFEVWKGRVDHIIIELNSPGGAIIEGGHVIDVIQTMKQSHLVETRVGADHICLSMCVPIYLQGERRSAAPSSQWMFHEPQLSDFFTGEQSKQPEFEQRYRSEQFFKRYFENSEIDPAWRDNLRQEWRGKEVWRTGRELVDENSNIILELF